MNLSTSTIVVADDAVISLSGEIDMATLPLLHDAFTKALAHHPGRMIVIDLDGVTLSKTSVWESCWAPPVRPPDRGRPGGDLQQHATA